MHALGTAISQGEPFHRGPFPHRGALINHSTKQKDFLLIENRNSPMYSSPEISDCSEFYAFRTFVCLKTVPCGTPSEPVQTLICHKCLEQQRELLKRCRRAVDKQQNTSDDALRRTPHDRIGDSPTLLRKRMRIYTEDVKHLQTEKYKLQRSLANMERKVHNGPQQEDPVIQKAVRQATWSERKQKDMDKEKDAAEEEDVEDADSLLKRLGYEL